MKKKACFIGLAVLGLTTLGTVVGVSAHYAEPVLVAKAEEVVEPEAPKAEATVTVEKIEHGEAKLSITEGKIGDICVIDISHDLFYIIKSVRVNGVDLIEDENVSRRYSFALVEGENVVSIEIVVDSDLLGSFATMYNELRNKDWTNLFSVENVITIVKWVLDCGVLLAIARYYIRDKKLEKKVESKIEQSISKIIPDVTKTTVLTTVEEVITPIFTQLKADNIELMNAMSSFAKCMALAQENTPESRTAIIDILSNLKISDEKTLVEVKAYIDRIVAEHVKSYEDTMKAINKISEDNKQIAEEHETPVDDGEEVVPEAPVDDGTSI